MQLELRLEKSVLPITIKYQWIFRISTKMNTVWLFILLLASPLSLLSRAATSIENDEYEDVVARQKRGT